MPTESQALVRRRAPPSSARAERERVEFDPLVERDGRAVAWADPLKIVRDVVAGARNALCRTSQCMAPRPRVLSRLLDRLVVLVPLSLLGCGGATRNRVTRTRPRSSRA